MPKIISPNTIEEAIQRKQAPLYYRSFRVNICQRICTHFSECNPIHTETNDGKLQIEGKYAGVENRPTFRDRIYCGFVHNYFFTRIEK